MDLRGEVFRDKAVEVNTMSCLAPEVGGFWTPDKRSSSTQKRKKHKPYSNLIHVDLQDLPWNREDLWKNRVDRCLWKEPQLTCWSLMNREEGAIHHRSCQRVCWPTNTNTRPLRSINPSHAVFNISPPYPMFPGLLPLVKHTGSSTNRNKQPVSTPCSRQQSADLTSSATSAMCETFHYLHNREGMITGQVEREINAAVITTKWAQCLSLAC